MLINNQRQKSKQGYSKNNQGQLAAFAKHQNISKDNFGICLKIQVYDTCVLTAMTQGVEA